MALSPMLKQYFDVKAKHPDCLLFFRLGDFYEMFFDDAKLVSRELNLVLTGKDCGLEERAPMCGIPYHSRGLFLSTLSLRRATRRNSTERPAESHFYPRSPCGERLVAPVLAAGGSRYFYPRSPCGERLFGKFV